MLREITTTRQDNPDRRRRWFQDEFFDLFVWQNADGEIVVFQLCYDRTRKECVLSWSRERSFAHNKVDTGDDSPARNRTPILAVAGKFPLYSIMPRFEQAAAELAEDVKSFVIAKLREYPRVAYGTPRKPRRRKHGPTDDDGAAG
jgi:hypothetical protein